MKLWLLAVSRVARRIPELVRWECRAIEEDQRLRQLLAVEWAEATWRCVHGDVWRQPSGQFRRLLHDVILPVSVADAEDFHGYVRQPGERSW